MDFEIYCDESRQELLGHLTEDNRKRYVLIGGLWIEAARRMDYKARIAALREEHNIHGEFKWNRVSPSRQLFYEELVTLFFEESMRFRCIVLPAEQADAITFHDGDSELMFYKFYYQLLKNWILDFNTYRIFVDMRTNRVKNRLKTLQVFLSQSNRFANIGDVQSLPSQDVDLLQLADVLVGVVNYKFNASGRSEAKMALVNAVEKRLRHPIQPTPKTEEKFNVFRWRPGGGW